MRIVEFFEAGAPVISFEFFPPKSPEAEASLGKAIEKLRRLGPSYVSVTYGAGGSTREKTVDLVCQIKRDFGVEAMAHLTCVGSAREELRGVLDKLQHGNIDNVLALRGDPPKGETKFVPHEDGFHYASELTEYITANYSFCVGGACYPEGHLECDGLELDLQNLLAKVNAGAEFLISQLFFDAELYFSFVKRAHAIGIQVPIVPGIMPVTNLAQVERFTSMCGATIPEDLHARLQKVRDDNDAVRAIGVEHATEQCATLLRGGAPGVHFYTLNRSPATRAIFEKLREHQLV